MAVLSLVLIAELRAVLDTEAVPRAALRFLLRAVSSASVGGRWLAEPVAGLSAAGMRAC